MICRHSHVAASRCLILRAAFQGTVWIVHRDGAETGMGEILKFNVNCSASVKNNHIVTCFYPCCLAIASTLQLQDLYCVSVLSTDPGQSAPRTRT